MRAEASENQVVLVLGVDGGGTKTQAAIMDLNGRVRGAGQAGPSNYDDLGVQTVQENLAAAIRGARVMAGLSQAPFSAVFFGMAGVVTEADRAVIRQIASNLEVAELSRVEIDHDCRIALAGGLSGRPGIVLITGTGTSCFGQNASGEKWLAGGWGHLIDDVGSGYWLGLQAIKVASHVDDGRAAGSRLYALVRDTLGLKDMRELMRRLYVQGLSRSEIAQMAPMVIEAAREGDAPALQLLEQSGAGLAACVEAVARKLNLAAGACEIVQTGGLVGAGEIYTRPLRSAILRQVPGARFPDPELPPVLGACLLALRNLGVKIGDLKPKELT